MFLSEIALLIFNEIICPTGCVSVHFHHGNLPVDKSHVFEAGFEIVLFF
jgi:hypothetical protein